jgi:hypothetical protein
MNMGLMMGRYYHGLRIGVIGYMQGRYWMLAFGILRGQAGNNYEVTQNGLF